MTKILYTSTFRLSSRCAKKTVNRTGVKNQASLTRSQRSSSRIQQIGSHRPCSARKPCDKLGWRIGDRQGTRQTYQMDQEGNPHPQGRTTSHEPGGGQLPTQSCVRRFSWHICYLLCQEPAEEMMTSFFWWRLPVDVETSRYRLFLVISKEFSLYNITSCSIHQPIHRLHQMVGEIQWQIVAECYEIVQ